MIRDSRATGFCARAGARRADSPRPLQRRGAGRHGKRRPCASV